MDIIDEKEGMTVSRSKLHELIMICIYQYLFYLRIEDKPEIDSIIKSVFNSSPKDIDPFAKKAILETIRNMQKAVDDISLYLVKFKFERLGLIEQAILVLAYVEMEFLDIPPQIAINIAVKLTQKYSDDESYKYVNAVLQKVADHEQSN
ncbi:MAG: transcription antitermination protein NusB [Bacilli bacterium]|nr:transcription antitermination protein NusB [Bacilli bacterium]